MKLKCTYSKGNFFHRLHTKCKDMGLLYIVTQCLTCLPLPMQGDKEL